MFYPFSIKASVISRLQQETPRISDVENSVSDKNKRKELLRSYLSSTSGVIDGKTLKELWFPKGRYQVFLSHSRGDIVLARYFKAWLWRNCGLRCFIDADVWEDARELLREIDEVYKPEGSSFFLYSRRNQTTAHVYSMRAMALFEAIDEIECPILIESSNSVTLKDGIEKGTLSPWIYEEVGYMGKLPHKVPTRLKTQNVSVGAESIILEKAVRDSLQMTHPLDVSGFKTIDKGDLDKMKCCKGVAVLDVLYKRKCLIRAKY